MPFPVSVSPNIAPTTENPFCCIGCCSSGDVNIIDPRSTSSKGQQQANSRMEVSTGQTGEAGDPSQSVFAAITKQPQIESRDSFSPDWLHVESSIEQRIDNVAINILNSGRAGRCCTVIYDRCSPGCTGNPGCPFCGCSDGEMGCGSCGGLLCGILDGCCVVGAGGSRLKLTAFHRKLKQDFSGRVISLAEEETGINLQDLLVKGRAPTSKERQVLEESCVKIQNALTLALGQSSNDNWKDCQDKCMALLSDPGWNKAIQKAGSKNVSSPRSQVKNVLIVSQCGRNTSSCENYLSSRLGNEISNLIVNTPLGVSGALGVFEGSFLAEIINEIIFHHPLNLGNYWISQHELRLLVCLVLAIRGLALQDTEGNTSDTVNHSKIKHLRKEFSDKPNCLMVSSAPLCCAFSNTKTEMPEDILITSMTSFILKDKVGEETKNRVEQQLMKRYLQARQRIENKNSTNLDVVVTQQPRRRHLSNSDISSSGSTPPLYGKECFECVVRPRVVEDKDKAPVVRPKIKITVIDEPKFPSKDPKKDDDSDEDKDNKGGSNSSFWI